MGYRVANSWPATLALILSLIQPLLAHEFWLAPSSHRIATGEQIDLYAMIGKGDKVEALERLPKHIKRFRVHDGERQSKVGGKNFSLPTGQFQAARGGVHVFGYESRPRLNTLPGARFDAYLKEEGLDDIVAERLASGDADEPGRERYARCAKSLVQVDGGKGGDRVLGFPFEIVAQTDPFQMSVGSTLVVQLLRDGEPIPGVLLKAFALAEEKEPVLLRSDGDGYVRVAVTEAGRWMLHAVFMDPLGNEDREADWESFWASLTFEIPQD